MKDRTPCPHCGGTDTWCDEVDVGVGIIYGPLHCNDCHYVEPSAHNDDFDAEFGD